MISLTGELVTLRDLAKTDVDDVFAIVGDPAVTKWLSFDTRTHAQATEMVAGVLERQAHQPRTEYYLAVCAARHGFIGFCRLGLAGVQAGKLGYAIRADVQGRGYATDACRTMLRFAFDRSRLHRVSAAVGPDNAASIAVVRKLGFTHEGRLRDHVHTNGAWRDSELFSLLVNEWERGLGGR
ncbi:GNAT family N-acetyltransferase [Kutzneria buriramensis]|uniref:RimJ/RimL family protein N-acetyltransferase n=1 Tax=Kutzneria buriramensis TaxID=1045776 RepID=A0A3E0G887_9PSEU|nr:GNAT family protein [Kutzneria buriramensis]REH18284.1 RimJ/RimL family protein N-acetyltransferase [Kutzneria buriramensis]